MRANNDPGDSEGTQLCKADDAVRLATFRAIRRTFTASKTTEAQLAGLLEDRVLEGSLSIRIGLIFGVVLLMTAKPGTLESLGILAASVILGSAAVFLTRKKRTVVISESGRTLPTGQ